MIETSLCMYDAVCRFAFAVALMASLLVECAPGAAASSIKPHSIPVFDFGASPLVFVHNLGLLVSAYDVDLGKISTTALALSPSNYLVDWSVDWPES
jgi:hypothetical protein